MKDNRRPYSAEHRLYVPVLGTAIYNQAKRSPLHAALPYRGGAVRPAVLSKKDMSAA